MMWPNVGIARIVFTDSQMDEVLHSTFFITVKHAVLFYKFNLEIIKACEVYLLTFELSVLETFGFRAFR